MTFLGKCTRSISAAVGEISLLLSVLLAVSLMGSTLNAEPITWYVQNAILGPDNLGDPGGQVLTGSFEFDAITDIYTNVNLLLPIALEEWTTSDLIAADLGPTELAAVNGDGLSLVLSFDSGLTGMGGTVPFDLASSGVLEFFGGHVNSANFINGEVTTVPEPGTGSLVLLGALGSIVVTQWRRILQAARRKRSVLQNPLSNHHF